MIPAVLVAVAVVASSSAFPFISSKPEIEGVPQVYTGISQTVIPEAEVQGFSEVHTLTEQVTQSEKTGAQNSLKVQAYNNQESTFVPKVQSVPVNVGHIQLPYSESSVLLPIQPLPSANQASQIWRPIVVPAEAIADGRVIITAAEPIQQSFQTIPEAPASQYQRPVQLEQNQQINSVPAVEKQTSVQQTVQLSLQDNTPAGVQLKGEPSVSKQTILVAQKTQKATESVENQNQVPVEQVYSVVENIQSVATKGVEHQLQTYTGGYTSDKTQSNAYQHGSSVQNQNYEVQPVEKVKQQVTEPVRLGYYQQQVTEKQISKCSQVQNQPVEQVSDAQQVSATKTENQEQNYIQVQTAEFQKDQVQTVEKQVPQQQLVEAQTTQPVYEQFQSVQPVFGSVTENHGQKLLNVQTPDQSPKSLEVDPNQEVFNVEFPEDINYAEETVNHFGDKISQIPVHSVPLPQSQDSLA